jgi:hypothetical protein
MVPDRAPCYAAIMTLERVGTTRTAWIERTTQGIIVVRIFPRMRQSVQDAQENIQAAIAAANGRCALLSDIRAALPLEPETRHFYSGKNLTDYFLALGILVEASAFGRMMGNIYLRVARPGIPTQLFAEETEALRWLGTHCA